VERPGYYYAPTVLAKVLPEMPVFAEETFGPVAAITRAADADEAVRLANRSQYGLGCAMWTRDVGAGRVLARQIEAGSVFINGMVASDPRLPFGGVKRSGYGRELGEFGIREFVNVKTVWIGPHRRPNGPSRNSLVFPAIGSARTATIGEDQPGNVGSSGSNSSAFSVQPP
jgi:succinate-semialdehyde dehydrogenase/glutarate-semialdehyde dehydrogenase